MVQQDDQSGSSVDNAQTAAQILQLVTQDLQHLQQGIVTPLSQEVIRLQAEKARLVADIDRLKSDYPARSLEGLSQQQMVEQQAWVQQLAQVLAKHLHALMTQRLDQLAHENAISGQVPSQPGTLPSDRNGSHENAQRLLASLDTTFSTTFRELQQELNRHQSPLSQQLRQMPSPEQQGEALLEALIGRLRAQVQTGTIDALPTAKPNFDAHPRFEAEPQPGRRTLANSQTLLSLPGSAIAATPAARTEAAAEKQVSQFQLGLLLVLLSTLALSFHNVVVRLIGSPVILLQTFSLGGYIKLGLGNSLLILWLRMLVVLPLMIPVAMFLYPPVWKDIKRFLTDRDRRPLLVVLLSGISLFLSQIFIYIAIGQIGPGVAVTILFMYPIVTVPLAWLLFGDRPTALRWVVMAVISFGVVLTAFPSIVKTNAMSGTGVLTAVAAGIAFAFYLIFMQLGFKKLHPVPVSLIQFSTIWTLSSLVLSLPLDTLLPPEQRVQVSQLTGFIVGGIVLGVLTLIGYLANNFGVRFMGAARASIVASSGPVITALLAFLLIAAPLQPIQWLGILFVTAGVTALSFEKMKTQLPAPPPLPHRSR